jgi:hypothetical protein
VTNGADPDREAAFICILGKVKAADPDAVPPIFDRLEALGEKERAEDMKALRAEMRAKFGSPFWNGFFSVFGIPLKTPDPRPLTEKFFSAARMQDRMAKAIRSVIDDRHVAVELSEGERLALRPSTAQGLDR